MSSYAEKVKTYYENGWYTVTMLDKLLAKGKLTQVEYDEIIGTE